jgi:uncharacterized protein YheU (UPF0270 family)
MVRGYGFVETTETTLENKIAWILRQLKTGDVFIVLVRIQRLLTGNVRFYSDS